jgi:hypothetical protein
MDVFITAVQIAHEEAWSNFLLFCEADSLIRQSFQIFL